MNELLTEHLLGELDHRFAEWTPSRFQAAAGWWLYLHVIQQFIIQYHVCV